MTPAQAAHAHLSARIGEEFGPSRWITVDQPMIDVFSEVTQDDQWIHVDPERAAQTPFGGTIAQGFLSLSLASRFAYDCFEDLPGQRMGINYGFDRLRFLSPVVAGARLRGRCMLTRIDTRAEAELMRGVTLTIEIEGQDRPALVADWLALMLFDPA